MDEGLIALESPEALSALGLGDSSLLGLRWIESGRDLEMAIHRASAPPIRLVCSWAHEVDMRFESAPGQGGSPLMWEVALSVHAPDVRLQLDFAGSGSLAVSCSQLHYGPLA